jgi:hypothetical protein
MRWTRPPGGIGAILGIFKQKISSTVKCLCLFYGTIRSFDTDSVQATAQRRLSSGRWRVGATGNFVIFSKRTKRNRNFLSNSLVTTGSRELTFYSNCETMTEHRSTLPAVFAYNHTINIYGRLTHEPPGI